MDIISAINDDETVKKVKCLFTDYQICLAERDELKRKLDEAQEMIKILTDTCDNLEKNDEKINSQKLDEIFDLLKQVADYTCSGKNYILSRLIKIRIYLYFFLQKLKQTIQNIFLYLQYIL